MTVNVTRQNLQLASGAQLPHLHAQVLGPSLILHPKFDEWQAEDRKSIFLEN